MEDVQSCYCQPVCNNDKCFAVSGQWEHHFSAARDTAVSAL